MLCTTCGAENANSLFCHRCRWQLVADAGAETPPVPIGEPATGAAPRSHSSSIFSAVAWLELRVGSVFAWTPRGFSDRVKSQANDD
jgi:hypothetical protein